MASMRFARRTLEAGALAVAFFATGMRGEDEALAPERAILSERPDFGTKDRILAHIGFNEFVPTTPGTAYQYFDAPTSTFGLFSLGSAATFAAMAHLPSGALLTYLELDYCDTNPTSGVLLDLQRCSYLGGDCVSLATAVSTEGMSGCHVIPKDLSPQTLTMDNNLYQLVLVAGTFGGDRSTRFMGAYIGYKLQLSTGPATPTFGDVPANHPYFRAIEALAASGISGGCGGGNFCPNQNVTRGEMAAFFARALGLHFPN
jgi:hypothetical protein